MHSFPIECPTEVYDAIYDFIASWHCGQCCPLYSLLSTRKIHSNAQINGLRRELRETFFEAGDSEEWQALDTWIATL